MLHRMLVSFEKQDKVLSELWNSVRSFEHGMQPLQMKVIPHKNLLKKNSGMKNPTATLQYLESNIVRYKCKLIDEAENYNSFFVRKKKRRVLWKIEWKKLKFDTCSIWNLERPGKTRRDHLTEAEVVLFVDI